MDAYRRFLRAELLSHIEKSYRTKPHRILVGHSFGGLFALNDLLHKNRLFAAYVAIDPTFQFAERYLDGKVSQMASKGFDFGGRLFMTTVPYDDDGLDVASADFFLSELQKHSPSQFRSQGKHYEMQNHQSVQSPSYYEGLKYVFDGYAPPELKQVARNPDVLIEHYSRYSDRVGATYSPDHSYLMMAGYNALREYKVPDQALRLFKMNVEAYPGRSAAWAGLGDYHADAGDSELAVKAFERALDLNEYNSYAARRLDEVRQK